MNIFKQIKEQVTTLDVAMRYGLKVGRNGMMNCPFHADKHPSMRVGNGYFCFGCGEKGDVIAFVAKLNGITPYAAATKIAQDMRLTLETKVPSENPTVSFQKMKQEKTEKKMFDQAVKHISEVYTDYFRLLNHWAVIYAPSAVGESFHQLYAEAMHNRGYVEYILDLLVAGSEDEKKQVIIEVGKEVMDLEERIRAYDGSRP